MIEWNHLKKVKSNYFKHFFYAMYFNILALLVFITGTIHAIFPFIFPFTPYRLAKKITDGTEKHFKKRD
tara:strand:+ start:1347 stop:1553 length:207 start_codon:yes stop_codon:yes gene_type:complete